ncbi:MAG: PP2C family protein-serine/threonine phosphatase, partial [Eggerthella sp.]|uniref:PP2C family protein-serine/threonine phosphatase n=1 Tax=Eggerthella sp. TaxID=1929886 RepID=UPI00290C36A1
TPPLYRHADGSVEWMRDRSGLLLGSFEGVPYRVFERTMIRGDSLILYTDGVTEAMDASDHCYGDERLFQLVERECDGYPASVSGVIEEDVRAFAEGADQADDITLLVLRYDGQENGPAASAAGNRG